ncbi:MAG TPA: tetratricopeptide repeat protein [Thermoanaerobaculia bacterium]|nr:tetratricopeptide repeat protein [Thermoanaerobaculia bacterium]
MARAPGETSSVDQGVFLVHLIRVRKSLREGRLDAARQELEQAQMLRADDEDVLNLLSIVEFKRGNFREAARAARELLAKNPESAVLHANLGLILFKDGAIDEAEEELRRAVEIKPDHARSHLYLGLLYRDRGKLGLALEHLRFAGAKKLVGDLEEALRKGARGAAERPVLESFRTMDSPPFLAGADAEPAESLADAPPGRSILRLATPVVSSPTPASEPAAAPPGPPRETAPSPADEDLDAPIPEPESERAAETETWTDEIAAERASEAHPLFVVRADGALEIASPGVVYVRKGSVVWYSGNVRFTGEQAFRGTRLESILRADGRGYLFVNDPGRHAFRRDLAGQSLSLEGSRLLALDHGLSFRLEPIHDFRMNRRVDILRIQGRGSVILSVTGPLLAHEISGEFPLIVSAHDLVAWSGNLLPSVLEDRFLEEVMLPDSASAPKIRFEGEGTVLTEPPRPRRRATDRATGVVGDRRRT